MHPSLPPSLARPRPRPTRLLVAAALGGLVVLGGLGAVVWRARPAPAAVAVGSGVARFNFRVTGIPVPGTVPGVRADLRFSPRDLPRTAGAVTVPLAGLNTGIALRDRHALNFLGARAHPVAAFTLEKLDAPKTLQPGQTLDATAVGALDLNGVTVPLKAPVTLAFARDGSAIDVETAFDVVFADHRISIPGADPRTDVTVRFRVPVSR